MQVDKNCNATVTAPNNQNATRTGNVNPSNGNPSISETYQKKNRLCINWFNFCSIAEEESQQQSGMKSKPGAANEGDAEAAGAASQSLPDTANPQQSQDLVNNSQQQQQQQHQMVTMRMSG